MQDENKQNQPIIPVDDEEAKDFVPGEFEDFLQDDQNTPYLSSIINLLLEPVVENYSNIKFFKTPTIETPIDHQKISEVTENYIFIPLSTSYKFGKNNHFAAIIIDKENKEIHYIDPAAQKETPLEVENLSEELKFEIKTYDIDLQENEKNEGEEKIEFLRHCGAWVVEIFSEFAEKNGKEKNRIEGDKNNMEIKPDIKMMLEKIKINDILNARKSHKERIKNILNQNGNEKKRKKEDSQKNNNLSQNKKQKTYSKIPAQYRRLDSLARLLALDMICAAAYYDTEEKTIYITTNYVNSTVKKEQKNENYEGEEEGEGEYEAEGEGDGYEVEGEGEYEAEGEDEAEEYEKDKKYEPDDKKVKLLVKICQHFQSEDFLESSKKVPEDSLDLLYDIYKTNTVAESKSEKTLANVKAETAKTIIEWLLKQEKTINPFFNDFKSYIDLLDPEEKITIEFGKLDESSMQNLINRNKKILGKLIEIKKCCEQVYPFVRDYRKFRSSILSKKIDVEHYKLLMIGDKDSHAEIKITLFLLNKYGVEKLANSKDLYIGISKLCCPHCYNVIKNSKDLFNFLYEDNEGASSYDDEKLVVEKINQLVRGSHDFWKENWVFPIFAKCQAGDFIENYQILKFYPNGSDELVNIKYNESEGKLIFGLQEPASKDSGEKTTTRKISINVEKNKSPILLVKKEKIFYFYLYLNKKDEQIFQKVIVSNNSELFKKLNELEFMKKGRKSKNNQKPKTNIKACTEEECGEAGKLIQDCLLASKVFMAGDEDKAILYQENEHSIVDTNDGTIVLIDDFSQLKENINKLNKKGYCENIAFDYCQTTSLKKIKPPLGERKELIATPSTSEDDQNIAPLELKSIEQKVEKKSPIIPEGEKNSMNKNK